MDPVKNLEEDFKIELDSESEEEEEEEVIEKEEKKDKGKGENQSEEDQKILQNTLSYSVVEIKKINWGVKGAALTELSLDQSQNLAETLKSGFQGSYQIWLGEMQASFLFFLMVEDFESFEHWKKMVHIMCNSKKETVILQSNK